jgi:dTDP-4-dehydrorhamnose 3,5-epimerase
VEIISTPIRDLNVVLTKPHQDSRGAFTRIFCDFDLHDLMGLRKVVQINISKTVQLGAVRGLHFQGPPHAEMKLVRCIRGKVWDVAVDLRANSPTFLQWHAEVLTEDNFRMLVLPEGFAHGFQVLEPHSELIYLHTALYNPSSERGIKYDDPRIGIPWPLIVSELSERDRNHQLIEPEFQGLNL